MPVFFLDRSTYVQIMSSAISVGLCICDSVSNMCHCLCMLKKGDVICHSLQHLINSNKRNEPNFFLNMT